MFYSHQLLARKAPLGQIWMAATMHAKMNRKKLNKLNIIQICEQILNPSVPMALRLSGILMGGVVIVYERKVKLLYDDVSRLLVEINEAWKVKSAPDRTLLPKRKSQAKFDAVTLPENQDTDLGEIEQSMASTNNTFTGFQRTNYFEMKLDNMDGLFMSNNNGRDEAQYDQMHQADVADITINENYESFPTKTSQYESIHLERFDIEGDEEMQFNNHFQESGPAPSSMIPSPPRSPEPQKPEEIPDQHPEEIPDQHPEDQTKKQSDEEKDAVRVQKRPRPTKKARKPATCAMDNDQTVIPGHLYQSWLQNTSEIVSKRGMKRKRGSMFPSTKISTLMDLPPTVLLGGLYSPGSGKIHYPPPLLKLWMRKIQPDCDSPSGKISPTQPPQPSSSSPPSGAPFHDPPEMPYEDGFSGFGSFEKMRRTSHPFTKVNERFLHPVNDDIPVPEIMVTPGNARDEFVIPGSGSDHGLPSLNSGRKRAYSSSRHSGSSLEPVAEDYVVPRSDPKFKLHKVSETGFTPDNDLLVETGPTQTQKPMNDDQPMDQMTNAIRMHFKAYFDLAGSDQTESLDQLAIGLNRKRAANLFYQTCVLATREYIRVEQRVAFGDIIISRGVKM